MRVILFQFFEPLLNPTLNLNQCFDPDFHWKRSISAKMIKKVVYAGDNCFTTEIVSGRHCS
jgi:hypothetical protein